MEPPVRSSNLPRVCLVPDVFPPDYGGPAIQAREIGTRLVKLGHEVTVITSKSKSRISYETLNDIKVYRVANFDPSLMGLLFYSSRIALELLIQRKNFDVVHFFSGNKTIYLPLLLLLLLGKKSVVTSSMLGQDDLKTIEESVLGGLRVRLIALRSIFVSISPPITSQSRQATITPPLVEIPIAIDVERFSPSAETEKCDLRKSLGIPQDSFVGVFVGAVNARKGAHIVAEAWKEVAQLIPQTLLLFIGPRHKFDLDIEQKNFSHCLDEYIEHSGLQPKVRFLETDEVQTYLKASDVFILMSRQEGLPNAVLEAFACSLPVIIGKADWVFDEDEFPGIITERNPALLKEAILRVYRSPELRSYLGQKSREKVLKIYSISDQVKKYSQIYGMFN